MKVLVTGLTGRMTGSDRLLYKYDTAIYALLTTLKDLGHDAEVKQVDLNSRPEQDGYDCALVGLAPFNSLSSRHIFGALHTVNCMPRRVAFFADDWSIVNMATGMQSVLREPQKRLFRLDNRMQREAALEEPLQKWTDAMTAILKGQYQAPSVAGDGHTYSAAQKWKLLAPLFPWGDPKKLLPDCGLDVVGWDPSNVIAPYDPLINPVSPERRERRWILATLQDHSPWVEKQGLKWPVDSYGNKRAAREGVGTAFVSEDNIKNLYRTAWGVLAPQYAREDGTGWWRMRYLHARDAGAVLWAGAKVGKLAGPGYDANVKILEADSDQQLALLADLQRRTLQQKLWSRDQALQAVETLVQETARG